jgi:hypothetical protein
MCQNRITPLLQNLLDVVVAYAAECELPSWCRQGLVAGAAAWDVCCDCGDGSGQLWVRLVGWEPNPDDDDVGWGGCEQTTELVIGVGSLRCVPTLDDNGNPPSAEQEADSATQIQWDADVLRNAVMCSLTERRWVSWQPLDNQGGCGGGEHLFRVPFYPCDCTDTTDEAPSEGFAVGGVGWT